MAIGLVLLAHFSLFFSAQADINFLLYGAGYFGVEMFFALSGFLIGRIIIADVLSDRSASGLWRFWAKRWLRTLPAYFLTLFVLYRITGVSPSAAMAHATFIQNWLPHLRDAFFGVSWSLAVEEWFYFITPIALLLLGRVVGTRKAVVTLCVVGIAICPLLRWHHIDLPWMEIRKSVFIRMDALLFGVLLAWIATYRAPLFDAIGRYATPSCILLLALWVPFFTSVETPLSKTLHFTATSLLCLPLIAGLYKAKIHKTIEATCVFVSKTSYAVYLIHWDIMVSIRASNLHPESTVYTAGLMLICLISTFVLAWIMHIAWEMPWLRVRQTLLSPIAERS